MQAPDPAPAVPPPSPPLPPAPPPHTPPPPNRRCAAALNHAATTIAIAAHAPPAPPMPPPTPTQPPQPPQHPDGSFFLSMPQPQQQPHPHHNHHHNLHDPSLMPPITSLLYAEGNAWSSLLQLHTSMLNLSRTLGASSQESDGHLPLKEEERDAAARRESAYVASLTQLAASADALVVEAVKIRSLRRVKQGLEHAAVSHLLASSSNETLCNGEVLARNGSLSIAVATTDLRAETSRLKGQLTQTRALVQELQNATSLNLPPGAVCVIGVRDTSGSQKTISCEAMLAAVHATGDGLSEASIAAALGSVLAGQAAARPGGGGGGRTFARRGERNLAPTDS